MQRSDRDLKATDNSAQHARFLETARALGCDEDEAAFDEKLKAVVGQKVMAQAHVNREKE